MNKKFIFDTSDIKGYRQLCERSNIKIYSKIEIEGFNVYYISRYKINFEIDDQLLRKLKIKNLNNNIKYNSAEYHILQLIGKSVIADEYEDENSWYWYSSSSGTNGDLEFESKEDKKLKNKYNSNKYKHKIKQYENKKWVRK